MSSAFSTVPAIRPIDAVWLIFLAALAAVGLLRETHSIYEWVVLIALGAIQMVETRLPVTTDRLTATLRRAMSRAVLKLSGFYALGAYGEDEGDFKREESKPLTATLISKAKDAIIRGEKTGEEVINGFLDAGYEVGESIKYSFKALKAQK